MLRALQRLTTVAIYRRVQSLDRPASVVTTNCRVSTRAAQEQERLRQRVKQELLQELEQEQADAELERRAQQIQLERQIETLKEQLVRSGWGTLGIGN